MGRDKRSFIEHGNETEDVLKSTTEKAVDKVNVATLAFVQDIYNVVYEEDNRTPKWSIVTVLPFPLEQGQKPYTLRAYCSKDLYVKQGDIVVVLFTNKNFRNNLEYDTPQESSNEESHPITCGVIINILYVSKGE